MLSLSILSNKIGATVEKALECPLELTPRQTMGVAITDAIGFSTFASVVQRIVFHQ